MKLELHNLERAVVSLERAIRTWRNVLALDMLALDDLETIKAGVIQNFEVAYEQCWKFIRRWLHENVSPGITDGVTRRELFRLAAQHHLIEDVDLWMGFHEARNLTSHTYDSHNADQSFEAASRFLHHSMALLQQLREHNA